MKVDSAATWSAITTLKKPVPGKVIAYLITSPGNSGKEMNRRAYSTETNENGASMHSKALNSWYLRRAWST